MQIAETNQQLTPEQIASRRQEIDRITGHLEAEKEQLNNRLGELYKEDEELWHLQHPA